MAFLNKTALQKTAEAMQVADHPLLKNGDIPMNVKQAYVQGCVLATLMDDEKVSDDERTAVRKIGKSLHLDDAAIQECFDIILGLQSQDDKLACLNEVISAIGTGDARFYFMIDFEQLLCLHGVPNEDGYGILDYIGKGLFKNEGWRRDVFKFEELAITADAATRYILAAEQTGNKWDCWVAGVILFNGEGIPKDEERAFKLFLKAANVGVPVAQLKIGLCYFMGRGVEKDTCVAAQWLQKSALGGDSGGQYWWGVFLRDGTGVAKNAGEAVRWFTKAADAGVVDAMVALAGCYRDGTGVVQDCCRAFELYSKARDMGNVVALIELGDCYKMGRGVALDYAKAFALYKEAADKGHGFAYMLISECCRNGLGVPKNDGEAINWLLKGMKAANKNPELMALYEHHIACVYLDEHSTVHNDSEAFRWSKIAAEHGNANAQDLLGFCYQYGCGVEKDFDVASEWYRKSAAQGNEKAKKHLAELTDYINEFGSDSIKKSKGFFENLFS